jgi:hypothetical protein
MKRPLPLRSAAFGGIEKIPQKNPDPGRVGRAIRGERAMKSPRAHTAHLLHRRGRPDQRAAEAFSGLRKAAPDRLS